MMQSSRIRTGYSFRAAAGKIDEVLDRLQEIGAEFAPITDRDSTFGFYRWKKATEVRGLRPVFGVELAVTKSINDKKPSYDYWTFVAVDSIGDLNRLVEHATTQFRYRPLLTLEQATSCGLIKITGHRTDPRDLEPQGGLFIGLGPSTARAVARGAMALGHPFAAVSDNRYPAIGGRSYYELICGRMADIQSYDQHIQTEEEWRASIAHLGLPDDQIEAAIANSNAIMSQQTAQLCKAELPHPPRPASLEQMCRDAAPGLGIDLSNPIYEQRLQKEIALISAKGYDDYFYIVADIVQWARERMLVGPARGSSCGSLVCYLLRITTIDPIPHGLIFERFIDINRSDMPDIDIDFSDQKRYMVFDYISQKYGNEYVARLGTVAMFKARSVLQEGGGALGIPKWKTERVADALIERSSGDSRALDTLYDTLTMMDAGKEVATEFPEIMAITKMEGHPRHASQHAAGVVIASEPISQYVAMDHRTGSIMADKKDAEDGYNLLKIDALGLTQLSIFEDALDLAGLPRNHLESLPLDDQAAFDVLNKGQWSGIFQFNGLALQSLTKQTKVTCFEDIVNITALARPGALTSGGASDWVYRKNGWDPRIPGPCEVKYPHPILKPYLEDTLGVVAFQEQIMNIGRDVGDLSWEDVTQLRKAMSKSLGKEYFDQFGDRWKAGAIKKGIPKEVLDKVWDDLCAYGAWCIAEGEEVMLARALKTGERSLPIEKMEGKSIHTLCDDGRVRWKRADQFHYNGERLCVEAEFEDGSKITCTPSHQFIINGEWKELSFAESGDFFTFADWSGDRKEWRERRGLHHMTGRRSQSPKYQASGKDHPGWQDGYCHYMCFFRKSKLGSGCEDCGKEKKRMEVHHNDFSRGTLRPDDLSWLCPSCHAIRHRKNGDRMEKGERGKPTKQVKLKSVRVVGFRKVYDLGVQGTHNFAMANGLISHNCFNKSHSVAYGLMSYWCCWLKAHHPFEFAAATLNHVDTTEKQIGVLREIVAEGYSYVPVDPESSGSKWGVTTVGANRMRTLVGPLSMVKGIGPKMVNTIIGARARGEPLPDRAKKLLANPKTPIDSLFPIRDRIKQIMPDPTQRQIYTPVTLIGDITEDHTEDTTFLVVGVAKTINPRDENEAIMIARRGGKRIESGPTTSLNLQMEDDTGILYCKVNRWKYERVARQVVERGRPGKAMYAVKGTAMAGRRFIMVDNIRYIGDMETDE